MSLPSDLEGLANESQSLSFRRQSKYHYGAYFAREWGDKIRLVWVAGKFRVSGFDEGGFDLDRPTEKERALAERVKRPHPLDGERRPRDALKERLPESISRSRREFLRIAINNQWEYFATFTLDGAKYDRFALPEWRRDFSQWVRNYRRLHDCDLRFVFVPERHKDGAWHMHGLLSGIPAEHLVPFVAGEHPQKLVDGGFLNWPRYAKKFGFCSLGRVRENTAAALYTSKYITKTIGEEFPAGAHSYYASQGLNRGKLLLRGHLRPQLGEKSEDWDWKSERCCVKIYKNWHELEQHWQVVDVF